MASNHLRKIKDRGVNLRSMNNETYIGIDESGNGSLVGPFVVAACVLPHESKLNESHAKLIRDCKKLKGYYLEKAYNVVMNCAYYSDYIVVDLEDQAELGMHGSLQEATSTLVKSARAACKLRKVVIDGEGFDRKGHQHRKDILTVKKADDIAKNVSAASIIARFRFERHIELINDKDDVYGWSTNKGYATPEHTKAILERGLTEHHRTTFKNFYRKLEQKHNVILLEED